MMKYPHTSLLLLLTLHASMAFLTNPARKQARSVHCLATTLPRRDVLLASSLLGGFFAGGGSNNNNNNANAYSAAAKPSKGPTNEVVRVVNGMKQRRLGGSDILVSALGLGTQRWVSTDFNAPDQAKCFKFMDRAILEHGVNLLDTAEQYPIPSDGAQAKEGDSEKLIGQWIKDRKVPREQVVIATKITGGRNVTPKNIKADCKCCCVGATTGFRIFHSLIAPRRRRKSPTTGNGLYRCLSAALATTVLSSIQLGTVVGI